MNTLSHQSSIQSSSLTGSPAVSTMLIAAAAFSVAAVSLWLAFFDSTPVF